MQDLCGVWHDVDEEVMRQFGGDGIPFQCANLEGEECKQLGATGFWLKPVTMEHVKVGASPWSAT